MREADAVLMREADAVLMREADAVLMNKIVLYDLVIKIIQLRNSVSGGGVVTLMSATTARALL
jgi:hypothetical protein